MIFVVCFSIWKPRGAYFHVVNRGNHIRIMTTDLEHGAPGNPSDAALKTPGHEQTDVGVFTDSKEPRGDGRAQKAYEKLQKLLSMGKVELNGVEPVPRHERTSKRYWNIFTVWCSINSNILG